MTTRESRFTDLDRAELLALALYRDGLCPLCGRPLRECSPDDGSLPDFFTTGTYCHATASQIEAINAVADPKKPDKYGRARLWITRKR